MSHLARFAIIPWMLALVFVTQVAHPARAAQVPQRALPQQLPMMRLHSAAIAAGPWATPPGNYPFQSVTSTDGLISVSYYRQSSSFAQQTLAKIQGYITHPIKDTLGYGLKKLVHIYLYNSRADFLAGAQPDNPDQTGAYTDFPNNSVYTPILQDNGLGLADFLPHELTHIVFHQNNDAGHIQDHFTRFYPLWLDEGLATADQAAGSLQVQGYEYAVANDPFYDIFTLFTFDYPTSSTVNFDCYAEAHAFITFIERTYGMTTFHQFIQNLHNGDYNMAMQEAFGADMQTIRSNWQTSIGRGSLKHDAGFAIATPAAIAYQPAQLQGPAVEPTFTPIAGQSGFIIDALIHGLLLTLLGLCAVGGSWLLIFWQRRNARRAELAALPAPYLPSGVPMPGNPASGWPTPAAPSMTPAAAMEAEPAAYSPPPSAFAPDAAHATQVQTATRSTPLRSYPWITTGITALIAPCVLFIEALWPAFAPPLLWSLPYRYAAVITVAATIGLLGLGIYALRRKQAQIAHGVGLALAVILTIIAFAQVHTLGVAQGRAYAQNNQLNVARQLVASNGASGKEIANIDGKWAGEALGVGDYPTTITHLRLALAEDPHNAQAPTWRTQLTQAVDRYGTRLIGARAYGPAEAAYSAQTHLSACDAPCQTVIQQGGSLALLAWARDLLTQNHVSDAMSKLKLATSRYGQAAGGKAAARVLAAGSNPLRAAFAAAQANDAQAASLLALLAALQQPHTSSAIQASEVAVPITGSVREGNPTVNPKGDQIFFLGFTSQKSATDWFNATTYSRDVSVVKIIATIGDGGAFSAALPPGYWYLPFWDDPAKADSDYYNSVDASDKGVFYLGAFLPMHIGVLNGF